ncbi:MAG: energy transducer TonB [Bdellovibrionota bacterium]
MRIISAILTGAIATIALFYFMAHLVKVTGKLPRSDDNENFIEFVRSKPSSQLEVRKRELPKKPPPLKQPPVPQKLAVSSQDSVQTPEIKIDTPKMDIPLSLGDGPFLGGQIGDANGSGDQEVLPLVRIAPQYPRKAAMSGKEGWVTLKFDILETGATANVEVINAKPKNLFDRAARQALLKWKYKPQLVDGKPVVRQGLKVTIDFKLDQ